MKFLFFKIVIDVIYNLDSFSVIKMVFLTVEK